MAIVNVRVAIVVIVNIVPALGHVPCRALCITTD